MFTRRGDSGETDTGLRIRVGKDSPMVDLEGTLDELNTFVGFALINSKWEDIKNDLKKFRTTSLLLVRI